MMKMEIIALFTICFFGKIHASTDQSQQCSTLNREQDTLDLEFLERLEDPLDWLLLEDLPETPKEPKRHCDPTQSKPSQKKQKICEKENKEIETLRLYYKYFGPIEVCFVELESKKIEDVKEHYSQNSEIDLENSNKLHTAFSYIKKEFDTILEKRSFYKPLEDKYLLATNLALGPEKASCILSQESIIAFYKKAKTFIEKYEQDLHSKILEEKLEDCPICINSLSGSKIHRLPCGHFYHKDCINRWVLTLSSQGQEATCPQCRKRVSKNKSYDDELLNHSDEEHSTTPTVMFDEEEELETDMFDEEEELETVMFDEEEDLERVENPEVHEVEETAILYPRSRISFPLERITREERRPIVPCKAFRVGTDDQQ